MDMSIKVSIKVLNTINNGQRHHQPFLRRSEVQVYCSSNQKKLIQKDPIKIKPKSNQTNPIKPTSKISTNVAHQS